MTISFEQLRSYSPFERAPNPKWFQNSSTDRDGIGRKRWEYVSNGRYEKKHPIYNASGQTIGYMTKGWNDLAYTYGVIYSDRAQCFFVMHSFFRDDSQKAKISTVEVNGRFWFGEIGDKYGATGRLVSQVDHTMSLKAFRTLRNESILLIVSEHGFSTIDMAGRRFLGDVDFADRRYQLRGFAVSPDHRILAVSHSNYAGTHSQTGLNLYQTSVVFYDLETGQYLGSIALDNKEPSKWELYFDKTGSKIEAVSGKFVRRYQLRH